MVRHARRRAARTTTATAAVSMRPCPGSGSAGPRRRPRPGRTRPGSGRRRRRRRRGPCRSAAAPPGKYITGRRAAVRPRRYRPVGGRGHGRSAREELTPSPRPGSNGRRSPHPRRVPQEISCRSFRPGPNGRSPPTRYDADCSPAWAGAPTWPSRRLHRPAAGFRRDRTDPALGLLVGWPASRGADRTGPAALLAAQPPGHLPGHLAGRSRPLRAPRHRGTPATPPTSSRSTTPTSPSTPSAASCWTWPRTCAPAGWTSARWHPA